MCGKKIHLWLAGAEEDEITVRVLIVTGAYPPAKCGVGEYTAYLAEALAAQPNIEVAILTGKEPEASPGLSAIKVFRVMPSWRIWHVLQIKRIVAKVKPDIVHVQYPAQGYIGRLPKITPLLMRILGLPVVQTWHEHYVECKAIGWPNLLACDGMIYVRPDFISKLPSWVRAVLAKTPIKHIPNASTIPSLSLSVDQALVIKNELSISKPIVCYFGFAHPNKGVERLFQIADPEKHHLVLVCDLNEAYPYQKKILDLANQAPWTGKVTVTGFQTAQRVGEILAVADAVVFPFPGGAGEWNTSLKAAEKAGAFTIATTCTTDLLGYHEEKNIYFAGCDDISAMKEALNRYLGTRKAPVVNDDWEIIALSHIQLYQALCEIK